TLVSTNRITAAGMVIHFEGKLCKILSMGPKCRIIAKIPQVEGLYTVLVCHQLHYANLAKAKLTVFELHKVLGHVSQTAIVEVMRKALIKGVELDSTSQPEFCEACIKVKATHHPLPKETEMRAERYGERVHTDLWGPSQTVSLGGCTYYMSFTDDYT
ncbi:hypothetical protein DFJ58DRAFT_624741, partial [Suillus subalutaceus]|uniref:uncharacterized protein n=1 Tax=Suillus subalutaceus TaxID=48586 RepID=UPI001B86094B